jgi:F-type H+-transporting ATPase subunit alpha
LNLEEDNVGVVLLGPSVGIKEGSIAKNTVLPLLKWRKW